MGGNITVDIPSTVWLNATLKNTEIMRPHECLPEIACTGDCDGDGAVTINELIRGVTIALAIAPIEDCPALDRDRDGTVTVNELISAVNNALGGC